MVDVSEYTHNPDSMGLNYLFGMLEGIKFGANLW